MQKRKTSFKLKPVAYWTLLFLCFTFYQTTSCLAAGAGENLDWNRIYDSKHFDGPTVITLDENHPVGKYSEAFGIARDPQDKTPVKHIDITGGPLTINVNPIPNNSDGADKLSAQGHEVMVSCSSIDEGPDRELNLNFDTALEVNVTGYAKLSDNEPTYNRAEGIKFEAFGFEKQIVRNNAIYKKPVTVKVTNRAERPIDSDYDVAYGVVSLARNSGCNDITFNDKLTIDLKSDTETTLAGYAFEDNDAFKTASTNKFLKDVSINVEGTRSSQLYGLKARINATTETNHQTLDLSQSENLTMTVTQSAKNSETTSTKGYYHYIQDASSKSTLSTNNKIMTKSKKGKNYGINFDVFNGTAKFSSGANTGITVINDSGEESAGIFNQTVSSSIKHEYGDINVNMQAAGSSGIQFHHWTSSDANYEFNGQTTITSDTSAVAKNLYYSFTTGSSNNTVEFNNLTLKTPGDAVSILAQGSSIDTTTVNGHVKLDSGKTGFSVRSDGTENTEATLIFNGGLDLKTKKLFTATGSNAHIKVESDLQAPRSLFGTARASNWAEVSLSLSGADNKAEMDAYCHDGNPNHLGEVTIRLKDKAEWSVRNDIETIADYPSMITKLDLNAGGVVNLTNLVGRLQPGENPSRSLATHELTGDGGVIKLNVNTAKETGQVVWIMGSSEEGTHYIQASDLSATTAKTEAPILVVYSIEGGKRSDDYQARFEAIDPIRIGELGYLVGNEEIIKAAGIEFDDPEDNPNNWYLYLASVPEDNLNKPAKGGFEIFGAHHLAGMATEEMLRDRLGDVHRFMELQQDTTPWVKAAARGWKARKLTGLSGAKYDVESIKLGIDKRMDVRNLAGAYFGYDRIATRSTDPAKVRMHAWEGGLYWTHLADNQAYWDAIARYGHSRSRMTVGGAQPDRASGVTGEYFGLSLEAGRRFELNEDWRVEPKAKASYTRFSSMTMVTDQGLKARMGGYDSLTTRIGSTLERGFKTKEGTPWNLYGKAFFEREWLADPDVVFNGANRYGVDFKGNCFVYGLGADGEWRNGATWHLGVERSAGGHFEEKWRVDANLRIPF